MKFKILYVLALIVTIGFTSCSNLEEELNGTVSAGDVNTLLDENPDFESLIGASYGEMRLPYQDQSRFWAAQQHTSDETMGPTRGPDWDDNGVWRVMHNHQWDADHSFLGETFNDLMAIIYSTTNILRFPTLPANVDAEARFLRAFTVLSVVDGWGQVPMREPGEDLINSPRVMQADEAVDFIISEVNAVMADLPDGPANRANKNAAKVLLMKAHLNKGTFTSRDAPKFDDADMQAVIDLADEIMGSGAYSVADNFYDNFAPNNDQISTENIFTAENIGGSSSGNVRSRWMCTLHYNQNPSGWNGFTTIADFYNKFDDADVRKGGDYTGTTDISGIKVGFLQGQQFDQDGTALEDRKGAPLFFTEEVALTETGQNLEVTGVRVIKYPLDYVGGDNADNDYVYYRYSDVLLMKAEAMHRKNGDATGAAAVVNMIRSKRNMPDLSSISLDELIDERGFELYWEGHRRQDLIRFGKFLDAWNEKPATGSERLLFPIPTLQLALNPNLQQNAGY